MKTSRTETNGGFTLIEIIMALAILGLVVMAIYASWTLIIRSAKIGLAATAQVQRERMAVHCIEEAFMSARSFAADLPHYGFVAENGSEASLSFVARLPNSFPRSGKFGDFDVRRVTFSVESGPEAGRQLVLRQNPILMDLDQDEVDHPLVLAKNVDAMVVQFWDAQKADWLDEWTQTNNLPVMVKVTLAFVQPGSANSFAQNKEEVTRIIALPSKMVPAVWQVPNLGAGGGNPGQPVPGQPNPGLPGGNRQLTPIQRPR